MPAPIIPWQPSNIPLEIQQELDRRKKVRNFNYTTNQNAGWDKKNGDWSTYKGPMSPWVRVCSNSAGHDAVKKPRFVFYGGKNFYDVYGFNSEKSGANRLQYQIIGYTPTNPPIQHTIENNLVNPFAPGSGEGGSGYPIHVPTPEITKINVTVQKELYRRAEIEWTCFSWEQLVYMTPYFLIPGISVMLEWGWNHFNPTSLVKLDDEQLMAKLWRNAYPLYIDNIIRSRGNYDVLYGIITNFHWSMEGNRITCMTEVTSKDRLYAGISKDMGLTVNDPSDKNEDTPRPIYQALRDFISKDSTLANLKAIAEEPNPNKAVADLTDGNVPLGEETEEQKKKREEEEKAAGKKITPRRNNVRGAETQNVIWKDIIRPILSEPNDDIRGMKAPYIRGIFCGRQKKFYNDRTPINGIILGKPYKNDFDYSSTGQLDKSKFWINMGMIVEILNYFSNLDGGKGEPMFQVDIMGTVIGAHPNMISCNKDVLIPNAKAPKAHYGQVGIVNYSAQNSEQTSQYVTQYRLGSPADLKADKLVRRVCYQGVKQVCYRNDIDTPINYLRYKYSSLGKQGTSNLGYTNYMKYFSFPSKEDKRLPVSSTGLGRSTSPGGIDGNLVEKDVSGLLSNIYLSYSAFESIIMDPDPRTASYVDIYRKILSTLNDAVDGFWDLTLVEVDNIMTVMDKNYIGTRNKDSNPTYSFDYYDADSIIRSLKFRPALSDAQATRAIYGEVNNPNSKYVHVDKNDLLDYKFKDAIVLNKNEKKQGDPESDLEKRNTANQQMRDLIGDVQKLNVAEDDGSLQMTINKGGVKKVTTGGGYGFFSTQQTSTEVPEGPFEYLKLCLPPSVGKQIFRLLIDDKDYGNNPRYCAIQPGITLELTIQGCGGLRTFQYFLVKNLPEPYSHKNIIFRIIDVKHIVSQEGNGWETIISAGILPLRKYIKDRLTPPSGGWYPEPTNPT